jgi:hypothetical protein
MVVDPYIAASPEEFSRVDPDKYAKIVICVFIRIEAESIAVQLQSLGVPSEKIEMLSEEYKRENFVMEQRIFYLKDFSKFVNENEFSGSTAECGVFRGDFAKHINSFFPERQLYLFDTFESFSDKDLQQELDVDAAYSSGLKEYLEDTSVQLVMTKMKYPENIIIKKGWFPKTAEGVDDNFIFVSLDMDLYAPMFEGLRFFWNKLVSGGVILLHDYFCSACSMQKLDGVKRAVADFERELGYSVAKTTIGDGCSLAIIKM